MLTVYRSNRAEWLARVLSEGLRLTPPQPFEKVEIIVNTWPTSKWLSEELAVVNGISALVSFPFPGARLRQLVRLVLGLDENLEDPWKANRLAWHVLDVFPEFLEQAAAKPLKEWINRHPSAEGHLNREAWQLARTVADAFNDYVLYRPELIMEWLKETDTSTNNRSRENSDEDWQRLLMRRLSNQIKSDPFGVQVKLAVERLKHGLAPAQKLPKELNLFGISSLAPVQVELIQALSGFMNIKIFLLTPCPELWRRCELRRLKLGNNCLIPPDGNWLNNSPRLEAILGRMGAEFQLLLEGSGEYQLGKSRDENLFASPTTIAKRKNREASLLEQIQEQLANNEDQKPLNRVKDDSSLLFVSCQGQLRQVQIVRDQLLQWLAKDPSLEPKDILIMTPQVDSYAPYIASVFNDIGATNVELPWKITDRNQANEPGLIQGFLLLLQLAGNRINASALDSLLANPALQELQKLDQEDANAISNYLQLTGFRWGLDAQEREGDEEHSLSWCLDRWLLGLILPQKNGTSTGGIAPFSEGITSNELLKWWPLLSGIFNEIKVLREPRKCSEWIKVLKSSLNKLFKDGGSWSWEYKYLIAAIEEWKTHAGDCSLNIEVRIVADVLNELLNAESSRYGHRSGKITISALEPMRTIPHRVIILMGLDSDVFPRYEERPGFHLLEQNRQLGDPRKSDQDRHVLLEALMSTRQHLMLTWNCTDEKTGDPLPAPSPIQQWLSQLKNKLGDDSYTGLLRQPPSNPLSRLNFISDGKSEPLSCDKRNLKARIFLDRRLGAKTLGLAIPLNWTFPEANKEFVLSNELIKNWLIAPQITWLESLRLYPKEWITISKDLEDLELNELQRHRLLNNRLIQFIENLSTSKGEVEFNENPQSWTEEYAGQGILPPSAAKNIESEILEKRWGQLQLLISKIGPLKKEIINVNDASQEILFAGDTVVIIEAGQLKAKGVMKGWLRHLQICASLQTPPHTVVIARSSSPTKKDNFEIALKFTPINSKQAITEVNKIKCIANQGLEYCWPIPPESGWALAQANLRDPQKGNKSFVKSWDGNFKAPGERNQSEMQLCFGTDQEASDFLLDPKFIEAFSYLYQPLMENLSIKT